MAIWDQYLYQHIPFWKIWMTTGLTSNLLHFAIYVRFISDTIAFLALWVNTHLPLCVSTTLHSLMARSLDRQQAWLCHDTLRKHTHTACSVSKNNHDDHTNHISVQLVCSHTNLRLALSWWRHRYACTPFNRNSLSHISTVINRTAAQQPHVLRSLLQCL